MPRRGLSIPVTDRTLCLRNPGDMLRKLEWEVALFCVLEGPPAAKGWPAPLYDRSAALFAGVNAASTAYHLCDWFAAALTKPEDWAKASDFFRMPGMSNLKDLQRVFCEPLELLACAQICLASKHFALSDVSREEGFSTNLTFDVFTTEDATAVFWRENSHLRQVHGKESSSTTTIGSALRTARDWWRHTLESFGLAEPSDPGAPQARL